MAQPTISRHLKVLREASVYLERFGVLWEDRLDRMELYLNELQADQ